MRLMGVGKLHALARSEDRALAGAASALWAELSAARWKDAGSAHKAFPLAVFHAHCIEIGLDADHCVVVAVNFEAQALLVEFAGARTALKSAKSPFGRIKDCR